MEIGLNRYLSLEPGTATACARLEGRVIAFSLSDWGVNLSFAPERNGVRVDLESAAAPDVRLSGSVIAFTRLLTAGTNRQAELASGRIRVEGDAALADQFTRLLESVDPDLEELLAPIAGDVLAHPLGRLGRRLRDWRRYTTSTLSRDVAEYLREETGDLVHRVDVDKWMNRVDELADDVDRLTARFQRLGHGPEDSGE